MPDLNAVTQQTASPEIRAGEAVPLTVTGTFTADPSGWAVELRVRLLPSDDWTVFDTGITAEAEEAAADVWAATWTVPLTAADTTGLDPGLNEYEVFRTDAGSETRISAGTVLVI